MDAPPPPPPQRPLPPPPAPNPPPLSSSQPWLIMCHLSGLFFGIFGPLIVWAIKKDEMPEIDAHGKEAMNFQISITIYMFVSFFLFFVLIGIPLLIATFFLWVVGTIVATVKANTGELYRYPLAIRFFN